MSTRKFQSIDTCTFRQRLRVNTSRTHTGCTSHTSNTRNHHSVLNACTAACTRIPTPMANILLHTPYLHLHAVTLHVGIRVQYHYCFFSNFRLSQIFPSCSVCFFPRDERVFNCFSKSHVCSRVFFATTHAAHAVGCATRKSNVLFPIRFLSLECRSMIHDVITWVQV